MALAHYMVKIGLKESSLQEIIRQADTGESLAYMSNHSQDGLTTKNIYAILTRYCQEDGAGSIQIQYPHLYEEFNEDKGGAPLEQSRVINKNKKVLSDTYEDLKLRESEVSHSS